MILSYHTPASVVVNSDLEIVHFRGSTGVYLEHGSGKASFNLMKMAKRNLWFELRTAIAKAKKSGKPFRKEGIQVNPDDTEERTSIEVEPLKSPDGDVFYLILFEPTPPTMTVDTTKRKTHDDNQYRELEQELAQSREDMRSITEEQEATNEELQSANEEILSSNEELQSINEEVETSKEELESTNEELTTVNEELQNRNEELTGARDYAQAIIRTVQSPLIILDRDLRVKTANRAFYQAFKVSENETEGSFIYDLGKGQWNIPSLRTLLHEILPKNNYFDNYEVEHTFPSIGHKIMLLNARKFYKDGEHILLSIEDITTRKELELQKDEFISIASHELKTPITSTKVFMQLLQKTLEKSTNKQSIYFATKVEKQIDKLHNLISDLFDIRKIKSGKMDLYLTP